MLLTTNGQCLAALVQQEDTSVTYLARVIAHDQQREFIHPSGGSSIGEAQFVPQLRNGITAADEAVGAEDGSGGQ
jgi:hypothetical protein